MVDTLGQMSCPSKKDMFIYIEFYWEKLDVNWNICLPFGVYSAYCVFGKSCSFSIQINITLHSQVLKEGNCLCQMEMI